MKEKITRLFENHGSMVQFIKFCFVGVSNTLISYGIDMLCYYILFVNLSFAGLSGTLGKLHIACPPDRAKVIVITIIAFTISVTNSFFWNNRFVFVGERTGTEKIRVYLKTVLCYGFTGILLSPYLKILLTERGVPYWFSAIITLVITVPINYLLNKFWAYAKTQRKEGT